MITKEKVLVSITRADLPIPNIPRKRKELAVDRRGEEVLIKPSTAASATPRALPPTAITATGQEPVSVPVPGAVPPGDAPLVPAPSARSRGPEGARTPTGAGRGHLISKVGSAGRVAVGNRFLTQQGPRSPSASPFPPGSTWSSHTASPQIFGASITLQGGFTPPPNTNLNVHFSLLPKGPSPPLSCISPKLILICPHGGVFFP